MKDDMNMKQIRKETVIGCFDYDFDLGMEFKEYFPCFNLGKILNEIELKSPIQKKPKSPRKIFVKK